jgi:hypothetical protein
MKHSQNKLKRILTDAAGYLLIILAILTGWLPGPGGIPLALAGLGLLSINNTWAKKLRVYALSRSEHLAEILFPKNSKIQLAYDALALVLIILVAVLAWSHSAIWQISVAAVLFFAAVTIAAMNRDRVGRLRRKR